MHFPCVCVVGRECAVLPCNNDNNMMLCVSFRLVGNGALEWYLLGNLWVHLPWVQTHGTLDVGMYLWPWVQVSCRYGYGSALWYLWVYLCSSLILALCGPIMGDMINDVNIQAWM